MFRATSAPVVGVAKLDIEVAVAVASDDRIVVECRLSSTSGIVLRG